MKAPAYARALRKALEAGMEPQHGLAVYLDQRPPASTVCAPLACFADTEPEDVDWSMCAGRDVHVANAGVGDPGRLGRLVKALVAVKPRRLQVHRAGARTEFVVVSEGKP